MPAPRPLNVIWNRTLLDSVLEGHFIHEVLLADIGRPLRIMAFEAGAGLPLRNDILAVGFEINFTKYLRELRSRGFRNIGLLHMGDELGNHDRTFYADADYVLRNYWFEHALVKPSDHSLGVIWIPNGYRTGVGPISPVHMLDASERSIVGFFAGTVLPVRAERQHMMDVVRDAKLPFITIGTSGFGRGLGPVSYAAYLLSARFALVPGGNSPETIRLYDALEAGAIPIMLDSPFVRAPDALNNPPFILLKSWSELPAAYQPYANANAPAVIAAIEAKRREVVDWWSKFKATSHRRVKELIDRSFARADTL